MRRSTFAIGLLGALALFGVVLMWPRPDAPGPTTGPVPPESRTTADGLWTLVGPEEDIRPPSFDIVRIDPTGSGAASGRAAPALRVLLQADGLTVASTWSDQRGEWAMLIAPPLAPGDHALSLLAALADGRAVPSQETVIVSITERRAAKPLVVRMAPDAASEILQRPGGPSMQVLTLDAVDEAGAGALRFGGRAEPGIALNLYVDGRHIGGARADGQGRWQIESDRAAAAPGAHRIRLDALGEDEFGARRVSQRLEVPFERRAASSDAPGLRVESLEKSWRIEGGGRISTVIYGPGAARILDPAVTYPGQVTEPPPPATAAVPAADR